MIEIIEAEVETSVEVAKIESENEALINQISDIVVTDQKSYDNANGLLKEVKSRINIIKDDLEPRKKKAYVAYKEWLDLIGKLTDPLVLIEKILKSKLGVYLNDQEQKRKEKEQEAIRKAEDEKLKQAKILEKHGMDREADDVMATKPEVYVESTVRKFGTYVVKSWEAIIEDKMELIRAVADGKANINAVEVNLSYLNSIVRQSKGKASFPGIRIEEKTGVRSRG